LAPGDLLLGDQDGVLVVPKSEAAGIVALAEEKFKLEQAWEMGIAAGKCNRDRVDEALAKL
jgi:regulator of RNase E activity RraA